MLVQRAVMNLQESRFLKEVSELTKEGRNLINFINHLRENLVKVGSSER